VNWFGNLQGLSSDLAGVTILAVALPTLAVAMFEFRGRAACWRVVITLGLTTAVTTGLGVWLMLRSPGDTDYAWAFLALGVILVALAAWACVDSRKRGNQLRHKLSYIPLAVAFVLLADAAYPLGVAAQVFLALTWIGLLAALIYGAVSIDSHFKRRTQRRA
jgi:uncharacterized membrane protein YfcA